MPRENSSIHLSVDIEALDVDPSAEAGVITVAAVIFDRYQTIDKALYPLDPIWTPGTRSESTYKFWKDQPHLIQVAAFSGAMLPWEFPAAFSSFIGMNKPRYCWGFPARYDYGHLRSLYAKYHQPFPINFTQERDMTTLLSVAAELKPELEEELTAIREQNRSPHDAMADAENQAARLQHVFHRLDIYR
jgi:hypothetical protein